MRRATTCRFCHKGGDLIKGAHKECKNVETRDRLRVKYNIDPSRYMAIGDRGKCARCDKPAEPLSKLNLCREHMDENKKEVIRKAKRKHMKKKRSEPQHFQPRVYVKPPQSQKMVRMSKAEKRDVVDVPIADTQDERAKVAALQAKARMERESVIMPSRWERASIWD